MEMAYRLIYGPEMLAVKFQAVQNSINGKKTLSVNICLVDLKILMETGG